MFRKHLIGLIFLWIIFVLGCFWLLHSSCSDSKMAYQRLMNYSDQIKKERLQEEVCSTKQTRYQVSKQILYKNELHRLQSRLYSEYSDLTYSKVTGELVEHFKDLICVMQEKFIDDSSKEEKNVDVSSTIGFQQVIRQFKAQEAIYSYRSGQLEAGNVKVVDYLLPGHLWLDSFDAFQPSFEGRAHTIRLSLFKEPHLKAQGFQAIFRDWGEE